jgi:hypothetical protein
VPGKEFVFGRDPEWFLEGLRVNAAPDFHRMIGFAYCLVGRVASVSYWLLQ